MDWLQYAPSPLAIFYGKDCTCCVFILYWGFVLLNLGTYFIMDIITNRFTLHASFGPRPGLCLVSPDAYIFRKYMPNLTQQEFVEQSHVSSGLSKATFFNLFSR